MKEDAKGLKFGGEFQHIRGRKDAGILLGYGKHYDTPEEALEEWKANRMYLKPDVLRYAATVEMLYIWQREPRANEGKVCILVIDQRGTADLEDLMLEAVPVRRTRKAKRS